MYTAHGLTVYITKTKVSIDLDYGYLLTTSSNLNPRKGLIMISMMLLLNKWALDNGVLATLSRDVYMVTAGSYIGITFTKEDVLTASKAIRSIFREIVPVEVIVNIANKVKVTATKGAEMNDLINSTTNGSGEFPVIFCTSCGYIGNCINYYEQGEVHNSCPVCGESTPISGYGEAEYGGLTKWTPEKLKIRAIRDPKSPKGKKWMAFELYVPSMSPQVVVDKLWVGAAWKPFWDVANALPSEIKTSLMAALKIKAWKERRKALIQVLKATITVKSFVSDETFKVSLKSAIKKAIIAYDAGIRALGGIDPKVCRDGKFVPAKDNNGNHMGIRRYNDTVSNSRRLSEKSTMGGRPLYIRNEVDELASMAKGILFVDLRTIKATQTSGLVAWRNGDYDWYKKNSAVWVEFADFACDSEDAMALRNIEESDDSEESDAFFDIEAKPVVETLNEEVEDEEEW